MNRIIPLTIGLLELMSAGLLLTLGWQLPRPADVGASFEHAERVTDRAGAQVRILHRQVDGLRRIELRQLADRLQAQTRTVSKTLQTRTVDYRTVELLRDALGDIAKGLDGLAETLDPASAGKLGAGLGETADYLDQKLVPTAQRAAGHLEDSTKILRRDAERIAALMRSAPLDLKAVREIHSSLGKFREGLDQLNTILRLQRLETVREGFKGMETSLNAGAEQVERLAKYTYPLVTFNGLRADISQRAFWPRGGEIAAGMRKAATGVTAANEEMEAVAADMPKLRASLVESGKVVDALRDSMALALSQQDKLEPVLRDVPQQATRLAEDLPRLGADLARILRDTNRLKEVASGLREAQARIDTAVSRWPEMRRGLKQMGAVLNAARVQLDQALIHRDDYEAAMKQSVQVADALVALLPLVTDQFEDRLAEQRQALEDLDSSLEEVRGALPAYRQTAVDVIQTGRVLTWLVATIAALHGAFLIGNCWATRRAQAETPSLP